MPFLFPVNIGGSNYIEAKFKVLSSPPIAYLDLSKPLVQNIFKVFLKFAKKMGIEEEIQEPLFDEELSKERAEIEAILSYYAREDQALEELTEYPAEAFTPEHQDIALDRQWNNAFLFMAKDASIKYVSLKRYRAQKKKENLS